MKRLHGCAWGIAVAALAIPAARAQDANAAGRQALQQLVQQLQRTPDSTALRAKILAAAQSMNPPPAVPEEAHHHFIRAGVLVKEAQNPADLDAAGSELNQALLLAPWWGSGYYYLAVLEEQTGHFDAATANLKLYLLSHPGQKNAKVAQDKLYAIEVEKDLDAKRRAAAQAAAEQRQEEADWNVLQVALANQDRQTALAGPWVRTAGMCSAANIGVVNGSIGGSMTFMMNTSYSDMLGSHSSTGNVIVGVGGSLSNGSISGQASFPSYSMGACATPASPQQLGGSISPDGRTMELDTTAVTYASQTQGLIIATCVSVTPANTQAARCFLASQAPHLIPLLQVVQGLPPGSPAIDQKEAVKLVLNHGGNVNSVSPDGVSALHIAARLGNTEIAELLLQYGAQVDAETSTNDTPLTFAIESGSLETVRLLLEHGARPDAPPDASGLSPLYEAVLKAGNTPQSQVNPLPLPSKLAEKARKHKPI